MNEVDPFNFPLHICIFPTSPPLLIPFLASCNPAFDISSSLGFVSTSTPLSVGTPLSTLSSPSSILVGSLPIPLPTYQHDVVPNQSPSISIDQPIVLLDQSNSMFADHHAILPDHSHSLPTDQLVSVRKFTRVSHKPAYLDA